MFARGCVSSILAFLCGYEADICHLGLNPQIPGLWREVVVDASIPLGNDRPPLTVLAGDRIWASFKNAHLNVC
jgi:hypothetical protein